MTGRKSFSQGSPGGFRRDTFRRRSLPLSSGTPVNPYASSQMINSPVGTAIAETAGGSGLGLSPRQMELNAYYAHYRCQNYETRKIDWNGHPVTEHLEHEVIATQGYIPPGFVDVGMKTLPLKFRRPLAPFYVARQVVNRFSSLLFGEGRRPTILVKGDPKSQDYLQALAETGKLFVQMERARTLGGAMGSVAVGFELQAGHPVFTVFDPRWCFPEFFDKSQRKLKRLEVRYLFPALDKHPMTGETLQAWYWYRRVLDTEYDTVWEKVPASDGEDPNWQKIPCRQVEHHAGRVPAVWIKNEHVEGDIDGDPDCYGAFELMEQYDALMSQANRGIIANCDPTRVISSDDDFAELPAGSNAAVQVEKGGSVTYLELNGTGPRAAREQAETILDRIYDMVAYVPEDDKDAPQTAFEVSARKGMMLDRADKFRGQYGEAIVELLKIATRIAEAFETPTHDEELGLTIKREILLPKIYDEATGTWTDHELGAGGIIQLEWPAYFQPTLDDATKAATAVSTLVTAQVITKDDALEFLKRFMPIRDPKKTVQALEAAASAVDEQFQNGVRGSIRGTMGV